MHKWEVECINGCGWIGSVGCAVMATMGRGYAVDLCSITGLNRYLALPETRGVGLSHRCKATPVSACAAQDFAAQLLPVLAPLLAHTATGGRYK